MKLYRAYIEVEICVVADSEGDAEYAARKALLSGDIELGFDIDEIRTPEQIPWEWRDLECCPFGAEKCAAEVLEDIMEAERQAKAEAEAEFAARQLPLPGPEKP